MTETLGGGSLLVTDRNGVVLIELNRPDQFNALTHGLCLALEDLLVQLSGSAEVRCIVLTGRGRAFSVGVDLKSLESNPEMMGAQGLGPGSTMMQAFSQSRVPIIAAVNGFAVTGGFELALACDFIYAGESATFADTHARVGLIPGLGLSQKLPRLIGINRAREISFTGRYFSAEEGVQIGLVNRVLPGDALLDTTLETAADIATCIPEALGKIRTSMNHGWELALRDGLQLEGEMAGAYNPSVDLTVMPERLASLQRRARGISG